jgi:hypothetical protein
LWNRPPRKNFVNPTTVRGPMLTPDSDGIGRVRLHGLESGQKVHYRVKLPGRAGLEPATNGLPNRLNQMTPGLLNSIAGEAD